MSRALESRGAVYGVAVPHPRNWRHDRGLRHYFDTLDDRDRTLCGKVPLLDWTFELIPEDPASCNLCSSIADPARVPTTGDENDGR